VVNNIILADDHALILEGISNLLKDSELVNIVATALNGHELLDKTKTHKPHMIVTDIEMPEMSGIEAIKIIKDSYPKIKIVVLSMHNDPVIESILLKMDVEGIIYKNAPEETIIDGIEQVAMGKKVRLNLGQRTAPILTGGVSFEDADLTSREVQIIKMIAEGYTNKEIGTLINVSPRTVDTHRTNIMKKLNLHSAVDITRFAFKNKVV
jgi:DNA-binding NarL/FixJ family response regulator